MDNTDATTPASNETPHKETSPAVDIAFRILSERNGETMHYKALTDEVLVHYGDIQGDNPARTLIARLVNDDRFIRPARRGFYGLKRDYPNATSVGQRKTRSAPRSRTTA